MTRFFVDGITSWLIGKATCFREQDLMIPKEYPFLVETPLQSRMWKSSDFKSPFFRVHTSPGYSFLLVDFRFVEESSI